MAKLIHKNKIILDYMDYLTNPLKILTGLMFSGENKISKGVCLVKSREDKIGVTMLFCFYPLEILFIDSNFKVVDKVILKPWILSYTPKKSYKHIIESSVGKFKDINIGDKIKIK
jgi:uncharacterized membrane protein (UPF0127 family)